MSRLIGLWTMLLLALAPFGAVRAEDESLSPAQYLAAIEAVKDSLARVEWTLQFDKGEPPRASGYAERCPNCGAYHGLETSRLVQEERPLEAVAFILSPTEVIVRDPILHPRFVKRIEVCFGDQRVAARVSAYAKEHNGLVLTLAEPLKGVKPLAFDSQKAAPYLEISCAKLNGVWTTSVKPSSLKASATERGRKFLSGASSLVVDQSGAPVALVLKEDLAPDDSWKGSPTAWPMVRAEEMEQMLADLEKRAAAGVLRVALSFRSPKKGEPDRFRRYRGEEGEETERNVLGLLIDESRVVVLDNLEPRVTARLERIVVHPATGEPVVAKYGHALTDFGCFVATLERPLPGAMVLSAKDIMDFQGHLLLAAEIRQQGESRTAYFARRRITGFDVRWQAKNYPEVPGERDEMVFLADMDGALLVVPVSHRSKVAAQERYSQESNPVLTPVAYLREALANLPKSADPSNVPLTEQQENRIAWLGLELQPLNRELARANKVSDLTRDGQTGAMVAYVYPDSPAAKAGVEQGYILLRIHAQDQPKPIEVNIEESRFGDEPFPWDQLDRVPEEYYDRIPQPWPSTDNSFNQMLAKLGFGKKFRAEFFHDGKPVEQEFEVTESPAHFDSAGRFKSAPLGVTVRNLTYEVRRYFQKKDDEPGVIVSKIEPGSKASVAGVKPYEVVTHVNDQPVNNVGDFEKFTAGQQELRLSVKRMTTGRVVKIKMDAAGSPQEGPPKTEQPADKSEGGAAGQTGTPESRQAPSETP